MSDKVDLVATDQYTGYRRDWIPTFLHETVDHAQGEYVRGAFPHEQSRKLLEPAQTWRDGHVSHQVSKEYLPLYLAEFQFRHNNRNNPDIFKAILRRMLRTPRWKRPQPSHRPVQLELPLRGMRRMRSCLKLNPFRYIR